MLVLRFIGALFLLLAVIALTADLSGPVPAPNPSVARKPSVKNVIVYEDELRSRRFTSLYRHWQSLAPVSLLAARRSVETRVHPLLWSQFMRPVLEVPAFVSLGVLALLLLHLGRPRRRVQIFEN